MRDRGVALIMTLWILVLLSVVAMSFSFSTRLGSAGTRNFKEDTHAHYLAVSAYEEALAYLLTDPDVQADFIDSEGNYRTDEERDPVTGVREVGGMRVELRITDEESKININTITRSTLQKLFEYSDVPDASVQEILDSLADWKDPDDLHHHEGAEDEYYKPLGYRAKDRPLDVPEELLLIKGFGPGFFYGSDSASALGPLLTTWGKSININTVSPELLDALGVDPLQVDSILSMRGADTAMRSIPIRLAGLQITTSSANFLIQVTAGLADGPTAVRITSVVRRAFGPGGPELTTMYWKEDFENSGA